jgi:hypothetical protein
MGVNDLRSWIRTARTLSRSGLLWLALTAVAISSFVSSSVAPPSTRLIASSNLGSVGKLKTNAPGVPVAFERELGRAILDRVQRDPDAKRPPSGESPDGLIPPVLAALLFARRNAAMRDIVEPDVFAPAGFEARAPPQLV